MSTKNHAPRPPALPRSRAAHRRRFSFDAPSLFQPPTPDRPARVPGPNGKVRRLSRVTSAPPRLEPSRLSPPAAHDTAEALTLIPADAPWLRALGVTKRPGASRARAWPTNSRQIQKFAELMSHLLADAGLPVESPASKCSMPASGKGLPHVSPSPPCSASAPETSAALEARPELVELCNRVAPRERFFPFQSQPSPPALIARRRQSKSEKPKTEKSPGRPPIALHACDKYRDRRRPCPWHRGPARNSSSLPRAVRRNSARPARGGRRSSPMPCANGIFQERQAEFRHRRPAPPNCSNGAGHPARRSSSSLFSTEAHRPKNLMIAAIKSRPTGRPPPSRGARAEFREILRAFAGNSLPAPPRIRIFRRAPEARAGSQKVG